MAYLVSSNPRQLVALARRKLGLTQRELAAAVGSSHRTVVRWEADRSSPAGFHLHKLAALLHPVDAALAHDAALAGGKTLEQLGIVAPAPPEPAPAPSAAPAVAWEPTATEPSSAAPPPLPTPLLVDSVVYAALAALERTPLPLRVPLGTVRAVLFAAFARARDLRLAASEVADALAPLTSEPRHPEGSVAVSPARATAPAAAGAQAPSAPSATTLPAAARTRTRARRKGAPARA